MSDVWYMYDVWCQMSDVRFQTSDDRCEMTDVSRCQMSDFWYMYDVWCQTDDRWQMSDNRCQTSGVKESDVRHLICKICIMSDLRHLMLDVRHLISNICMMSEVRRLMSDIYLVSVRNHMKDVGRLVSRSSDVRHLMCRICMMCDVTCLMLDVSCLMSHVCCQTSDVWYMFGLIFAGYVPLASQSPYLIIVYSLVNCRVHLSYFWANK